MKRFLVLLSIIVITVLISGCTQPVGNQPIENQPDTNQGSSSQSDKYTVEISNLAFEPSEITIKEGSIVTWINKDSVDHTVTFEELPNCACPTGFVLEGNICNPECYYSTPKCSESSVSCTITSSVKLSNDQSFSRFFNEIGTFNYHCDIHPSMTAKIIVE